MSKGAATSTVVVLLVACLGLVQCDRGPEPASPSQPNQRAARRQLVREFLAQPPALADRRVHYGSESRQFGDLRVPSGEGPHPVAVLLHGGCWRSTPGLEPLWGIAEDLASHGIATWNLEYRGVDPPGEGWPETYLDVAAGIDYLRELAREWDLDLDRVVYFGHSAGGHLALWAAGRSGIASDSPIYREDPLRSRGVVSLAGPGDLEAFRALDGELCGGEVVDALHGGSPRDVPERYQAGSPRHLLPLGVAQILFTGADDRVVPAQIAEEYARLATAAGDPARAEVLKNAGHADVIVPGTPAWSTVRGALLHLVEGSS